MHVIRRRLATIAIVLAALLAVYAFAIEPNWLRVTRHSMPHKKGAATLRIAQLSDLHLQRIGWRENQVIEVLRLSKPDLLLLTGDAVDRSEALPLLDQLLQSLGTTPLVAVLGNWEYWSEIDRIKLANLYATHGGQLLINQKATLSIKGRRVEIIGLDDFTAGQPRLTAAITPSPESDITILLQHSPGMFDDSGFADIKRIRLDLCLAGHTHAGQITLFGHAFWRPPGSGAFTAGEYATTNCPLYVTSGIGTSMIPARFGARPEIAIFEF